MDAVVQGVQEIGPEAHIFTIDISCTFDCPLDWPLASAWDGKYYLDITMPFGSRASSGLMKHVADILVAVLGKQGVSAHMYLEGVTVVADGHADLFRQYDIVRSLFKELGLPEAVEKSQPLSQEVKWLGVNISFIEGTLAVPHGKLEEVLETVDKQAFFK